MEPLNVWEYEAAAAAMLEPGAHGYYAGGAGDEVTLRWNVEAFTRWQLRPRVLVDVGGCTTAATVSTTTPRATAPSSSDRSSTTTDGVAEPTPAAEPDEPESRLVSTT